MELKAEHVKNIRSLAICKEFLRQAVEQIDQLNEELRHQKYKRCVAIARRCFTKSNYHFHLARSGEDSKENIRKDALYTKWSHRWLNIAEQFKEAK